MSKINFYKSFADAAAFALCALADSIVYPSITFTFQVDALWKIRNLAHRQGNGGSKFNILPEAILMFTNAISKI